MTLTSSPVRDTARLRERLHIFDDPSFEAFCMDYFGEVYDKFSRGLRLDEKVNLLLDHCRRNDSAFDKLDRLLQPRETIFTEYPGIPVLPNPYYAHPYPMQANFTGRLSERRQLSDWLSEELAPVLVLVAIGGMGKSSLSWYWLHQDVDLSVWDGVLWWSFYESSASFSAFLDEAIVYVGQAAIQPHVLKSNFDKRHVLCRLLQQRRILLIMDGFERQLRAYTSMNAPYRSDLLQESSEDRTCIDRAASQFLHDLVAGTTKAKVLITSRLMIHDLEDQIDEPLAGCRKEVLQSLSPDDTIAFMRAQGVTRGTDTEILNASKPYGSHPLSLRLLSGLIARDKRMPGDIAVAPRYDVYEDLIAHQHHILETAYKSLPESTQLLLSQMAAFRYPITYDALTILPKMTNRPPWSTQLWRLLHKDAPQMPGGPSSRIAHISAKSKTSRTQVNELDKRLGDLIARGLVFQERQTQRFDLHPVVRAYAYDHLRYPEETHLHLCDYFANLPMPTTSVQQYDELAPVVELYYHTVHAGRYDDAWNLYDNRLRSPLYYYLGLYSEDIQILEQLLDSNRLQPLVSGTRNQTWVLLYLSMDNERIGNLERALELSKNATEINRNSGVAADLGSALVALASVSRNLGQLRAAYEAGVEAIDIFDQLLDPNWIGISHRNHAQVLIYCGDLGQARRHLDRAMEVYMTNETHFAHGLSRSWLYRSMIEKQIGSYQLALEFAQQAHSLANSGGSPYVLEVARALSLLAEAKTLLGCLSEAQADYEKALTMVRRMGTTDFESDILLGLAKLNSTTNAQEARQYALEALAIAEKHCYSLKVADIHNLLARLELDSGNIQEANNHIDSARLKAWADGPPFSYQQAVEEAQRIHDLMQE